MNIHPIAWLIWLISVLATVSVGRNPFYLLLVLLWLTIVSHIVKKHGEALCVLVAPWKFATIVLVTTTLFNALTVHVGNTVLFQLPKFIPLIGGIITIEAAFNGLLNGLVLTTMFTAFIILNHALPARALIRLIPRAFHSIAVVIAIALTFVPATLQHFEQIREAQAVRGHQWRGIRDWLPLLIPLLIGGLERAFQLAEAMTARGFASAEQPTYNTNIQMIVILGLILLLVGWLLRLVWSFPTLGLIILLVGLTLISLTVWFVGKRVHHTCYRSQPWQWSDSIVSVLAVVVLAVFLFDLPLLDRNSIFYNPYPTITMPSFSLLISLVAMGLLAPALVYSARSQT